jgi:hypothetical protein
MLSQSLAMPPIGTFLNISCTSKVMVTPFQGLTHVLVHYPCVARVPSVSNMPVGGVGWYPLVSCYKQGSLNLVPFLYLLQITKPEV